MSNKHVGSTLESLFEELGEEHELRLLTLKKVVADQLREQMTRAGFTEASLASAMRTSRAATARLLNPAVTGLTLETIVRASEVLGLIVNVTFARARTEKRPAPTHVRKVAPKESAPANKARRTKVLKSA